MKRFYSFVMIPVVVMILPSGCADSGTSGVEEFFEFQSALYASLEKADSLKGVTIPVLRAPSFEAKWGAPGIRVSESGNYELNYANPAQPFDRLAVHGSVKPFPVLKEVPKVSGETLIDGELTGVEVPQKFREVMIEGKPVKWFQESLSGGADGAYYSTEGFSLADGSGKTGYYRLVVEGGNNSDAEVSRRFSAARLAN